MSLWLPCGLLSCFAEPITVTVTETVHYSTISYHTVPYRTVTGDKVPTAALGSEPRAHDGAQRT
jgi:hypothetical protein